MNELSKTQACYDDGEEGDGSVAGCMTISATRGFEAKCGETDEARVFGRLGDDFRVCRKDTTSLLRGDEGGEKALTRGGDDQGSGGWTDSRRRPGQARLNGRGRVYLYTSWRIDKLFSIFYQEKQPNRKTCPVTHARYGGRRLACVPRHRRLPVAQAAPFPVPLCSPDGDQQHV